MFSSRQETQIAKFVNKTHKSKQRDLRMAGVIFSTVQQFFYRRADRIRAGRQHFQTPARQA
jgi:hypothetical protein